MPRIPIASRFPSMDAALALFLPHVGTPDPHTGCAEWTGERSSHGYGKIRRLGAHRVAWWLETGDDPGPQDVLHSCDNPPCVTFAHLRLGSHADNMRDMAARGRAARTALVVPDSDVSTILRRYAEGETCADLAREYGVDRRQINRMVLGQSRASREVAAAHAPDWRRRGFRKANTRLTDDQVREIRSLYATGQFSQRALAAMFRVCQPHIGDITRGDKRKHA